MPSLKVGVIVACLLLLSACGTAPPKMVTVERTTVQTVIPPEGLVVECPQARKLSPHANNQDLLTAALTSVQSLQTCNQDNVKRYRAWRRSHLDRGDE